jgi:hypothetical protein
MVPFPSAARGDGWGIAAAAAVKDEVGLKGNKIYKTRSTNSSWWTNYNN